MWVLGRVWADRRQDCCLYRRDDGRRTKIQSWSQDRDGCCCTRRQPLEALMKGAWTHEQIITAWYWRAQSCYYSFVMASTKTFVYAGPTLANLPLCLPVPRLQPPSTGTCTKPHSSPSFPASSILRPIAYPTVLKHMLSLAQLLHFSPLCFQCPAHMQLP